MAPALATAGRTHQERWHQEGVTLAEVLEQLGRLHAKVARGEAADLEHPHPRSCVMNLVVVAEDQAGARLAAEIAAEIARDHPLRAIIVLDVPDHGASRLDAEIITTSSKALIGSHIQCESIRLVVSGPAGDHLRSLVEPMLAPDVSTYLWWMGSPPLATDGFLSALGMADVLIIDSARFERPFVALIELAQVAEAVGHRVGLADLHWTRLRGWRELLAQFFGPAERLPYLHGINGVGIDYVGDGRGNRIAAALLSGWLASSLGWNLKRAAGGSGGVVAAYFEAARKHPVELAFRSVPYQELAEGEVAAIRIDAVAGGRTCSLALERDAEAPTSVSVHVEMGEHHQLDHVVWMPVGSGSELLLQVLATGRRDPVYLRALAASGELLRALR